VSRHIPIVGLRASTKPTYAAMQTRQKERAAHAKPVPHGNSGEKKSSETEDFFISFDPAY
jgi:hypothetical protein